MCALITRAWERLSADVIQVASHSALLAFSTDVVGDNVLAQLEVLNLAGDGVHSDDDF